MSMQSQAQQLAPPPTFMAPQQTAAVTTGTRRQSRYADPQAGGYNYGAGVVQNSPTYDASTGPPPGGPAPAYSTPPPPAFSPPPAYQQQ